MHISMRILATGTTRALNETAKTAAVWCPFYFERRMNMNTMSEQMRKWLKQHPEYTPKKTENTQRQKPKKRVSERFSRKEIESLMGVKKPTYKRNRGALKQK